MRWIALATFVAGVAVYWPDSPNQARWLVLAVGLCAGSLAVAFRGVQIIPRPSTAEWLGLAFIGWAVLSLAWSPDWRSGLDMLSHLGIVAGLYVLFRSLNLRRAALWCLPFIAVAAFVNEQGGFGNQNWQAEAVLVLIPLAMAVRFTRPFVLAVAVGLVVFNGSYTIAAVGLVWGLLGLGYLWSRGYAVTAMVMGFGIMFGGAWYAAYYHIPIDRWPFVYRAEIFYNTIQLWRDAPIFGHGIGGFSFEYFRHQWDSVVPHPEWGTQVIGSLIIDRAHNEFLQGLAQFGVIGVGLAVASLIAWLRAWRPAWPEGLALAALGVSAGLSFPLQNPATLAVFVAILATSRARLPPLARPVRARVWWRPLPIAAMAPLVLATALSFLAAQQWAVMLRAYDTDPAVAFQANVNAVKAYPLDRVYRRQLFASFLHVTSERESYVAPGAAQRIYDISSSAAGHWPVLRAGMTEYNRKAAE